MNNTLYNLLLKISNRLSVLETILIEKEVLKK